MIDAFCNPRDTQLDTTVLLKLELILCALWTRPVIRHFVWPSRMKRLVFEHALHPPPSGRQTHMINTDGRHPLERSDIFLGRLSWMSTIVLRFALREKITILLILLALTSGTTAAIIVQDRHHIQNLTCVDMCLRRDDSVVQ